MTKKVEPKRFILSFDGKAIRLISLFLLMCMAIPSQLEAKQAAPLRRVLIVKKTLIQQKTHPSQPRKKIVLAPIRKKIIPMVMAKKKPQPVVVLKKRPLVVAIRKKIQPRAPLQTKVPLPTKKPSVPINKALLPAKPSSPVKSSVRPKPTALVRGLVQTTPVSPVKALLPAKPSLQKKASLPIKPAPQTKTALRTSSPVLSQPAPSYLAQLDPHTRRNAELVGLAPLYSEKRLGKGQTVAVIECSGDWKALREEIKNPSTHLTKERKENYKKNFLPAIGGPHLHPEEPNDFLRWQMDRDNIQSHGAMVSSVILELAPHAKLLPVSTYYTPRSPERYDVPHALMMLSQRPEVNIINISAGHVAYDLKLKDVFDKDGCFQSVVFKTIYTPRFVEAFKAIARAGKVVVWAAGNEAEDICPPQFREGGTLWSETLGHLVESLDPESLKSLVLAGYGDPHTHKAHPHSNRPGNWQKAQERFLFVPGAHKLPYLPKDEIVSGSSVAAPLICAALADLMSVSTTPSKKPLTPRKAVEALLQTADARPEKHIYGRGFMRVDRAAKKLEEEGFLPRGK